MDPQPNKFGVYEEGQWTEHIQHTTPSGAQLAVMLVRCADVWQWGVEYSGQWRGGGCFPSIHGRLHPTRTEALDSAVARLRRVFGGPHLHDASDVELRQAAEVHAWCDAQKQLELFA